MIGSKASARAALRSARAALSAQQRQEESARAVRALLDSDLLNGATSVALFAAMADEADPSALEQALRDRGARIAFPRVAGRALTFHFARSEELVPSPPWGIREPPADLPQAEYLDGYLVPGLGFTKTGDRLGYGRGYFDRVLASRGEAVAVGFAFSCQILDRLPIESHDQRVDAIVTGRELIMVKK